MHYFLNYCPALGSELTVASGTLEDEDSVGLLDTGLLDAGLLELGLLATGLLEVGLLAVGLLEVLVLVEAVVPCCLLLSAKLAG